MLTKNDDSCLISLGDLIPKPTKMKDYLINTFFSDDFIDLINVITNNDVNGFCLQYYSKSINKKLSNFIKVLTCSYGLSQYYDIVDVIDSNFDDVISDDIDVVIINKSNKYYTIGKIGIINLCKLIENRYFTKWEKLFSTLGLEYNPIKPYDMSIIEDNTDNFNSGTNIQKSNTTTYGKTENTTSNNTVTYGKTENSTTNDTTTYGKIEDIKTTNDTTTRNEYGYQSVNNKTPISEDTNNSDTKITNSGSDNVNESKGIISGGSDNVNESKGIINGGSDSNSGNVNSTYNRSNALHRVLSKLGNIGNTSQQDLIIKERELWEYQIFDIMFKDLDKIFVRATYK